MNADRPLPLPRAIWGKTLEDFVGPRLISSNFSIDGRDGEHEIFWEAPWTLEPAWRSPDGLHTVHLVDDEDWTPATAILVEVATGEGVGFYAGGELWIDPEHRGRGLSTPLIACLVNALKRPAYDNVAGLGFSAAGFAAHEAAHRKVVGLAVEAGMRVPRKVRDEIDTAPMSRPKP